MIRRLNLSAAWLAALFAISPAGAQKWNTGSLPPYQPAQKVSGVIRNFGGDLAGLLKIWETGFQKRQPGIRFEDKLPTGDAAIGGLVSGADLAPSGREMETAEFLAFYETFHHNALDITVATGSYDVLGRSWGEVVFVNRANPLSKLTMKQLDGIFGDERTGGWRGFEWSPEAVRGANENIRTWGQLGLGGEWANAPIHTYGYAPTGMSNFFELKVFHGGAKWNANYRQYVETGSKQVPAGEAGQAIGIQHMFAELAADRFGIAWAGIPQAKNAPAVKTVALAATAGSPYIEPSKETFQNRTYPLTRSIYIYLNREPGTPVDPKLKEFLSYILSRDGQMDVVRQGEYLPLTEEVIRQQLSRLQ
jgi:phosphate transport system substrate-binding protein